MKPVCLVIGAGAGIGGNVAKRFARDGYHACLCRRSDEEGTSNGTSRFGRDKSEQMNLTSSGDRGGERWRDGGSWELARVEVWGWGQLAYALSLRHQDIGEAHAREGRHARPLRSGSEEGKAAAVQREIQLAKSP